MELLDDLVEIWFLKKDIRKGTQKSYNIALKQYCEYTSKSPSELIEEAEDEESKGIKLSRRKIQNYMLGYRKMLEESGKAPKTINLYLSSVRSFYDTFDIILPKIKLKRGDICLEDNYGKLLTKEDILKLANTAAPRERALIYLMALSGMAQNEARNITISKFLESASEAIGAKLDNFYDLFDHENEILEEILTLSIIRQKVNYRYITFIPPEAIREIINYIKERCYGRNEKIRIQNSNEPLFVNNQGEKMSSDLIVTNFRRIGLKIGLYKKPKAYSYWRSHALRKYFISTIVNELGDKVLADFLAGHKIDDTTRAYWYMDPEKLKKRYMKALQFLSLDNIKVKDFESSEFRKLNQSLEEKDVEIARINKKLELMESLMQDKEYKKDSIKG